MTSFENTSRDLRVSGYASLFDQADMSGDIVRRGAFAASLLSRGGAALPMLQGHNTAEPVGVWDRAFEDWTGLFVSGRLMGGQSRIDHLIRLVRGGAVSGLSIGYRTRRFTPRVGAGRDLLELELLEVSIVPFPMLPSARITQVDDITPSIQPSQSRSSL